MSASLVLCAGLLFPATVQQPGPLAPLPEYRTIDGTGNNPLRPYSGSTGILLRRFVATDYADGIGEPTGAERPSARAISGDVAQQKRAAPSTAGVTDFVWQWGQFLDHDIDLTPIASPPEPFDVQVPTGDPWFDPQGTGTATIPLNRSDYEWENGVREQLNEITAWIDASNVYGSDPVRARELRTLDGTGRLKTSAGATCLPFNENGLPNAPSASEPTFFVAGDVRANEQVGLTAMHTLFVREHNHWAARCALANPGVMSGDETLPVRRAPSSAPRCRRSPTASSCPVLLGPGGATARTGLSPLRDRRPASPTSSPPRPTGFRPQHALADSCCAWRPIGCRSIAAGNLPLELTPSSTRARCTSIRRRHRSVPAARPEPASVARRSTTYAGRRGSQLPVRPPRVGRVRPRFALNIQRGRDHGLPSVQRRAPRATASTRSTRVQRGEPPTRTRCARASPRSYVSVDERSRPLGRRCLAEPHQRGAMVGETAARRTGRPIPRDCVTATASGTRTTSRRLGSRRSSSKGWRTSSGATRASTKRSPTTCSTSSSEPLSSGPALSPASAPFPPNRAGEQPGAPWGAAVGALEAGGCNAATLLGRRPLGGATAATPVPRTRT